MAAPSYSNIDVEDVVVGSTMPQVSAPVKTLAVGTEHVQIMADLSLTNIIDDASATESYYGAALPGTAESAAEWRIMKKTIAATITKYQWAGGSAAFTNVWNDRATLSYS